MIRNMDVIPAIDIRGGKCVQLKQGDYARETVYGVDPVAMAQHWVSQGARRLHVVDLDAARDGGPGNEAIVARIVRQAGVPVQVAGGVRDHVAIHRWIDSGAQRVVIGTLAIAAGSSKLLSGWFRSPLHVLSPEGVALGRPDSAHRDAAVDVFRVIGPVVVRPRHN